MKIIFYVGEIRSGTANFDGYDRDVIFVTHIDQIITTHGSEETEATASRLTQEHREFVCYPDMQTIIAITPGALASFFGGGL